MVPTVILKGSKLQIFGSRVLHKSGLYGLVTKELGPKLKHFKRWRRRRKKLSVLSATALKAFKCCCRQCLNLFTTVVDSTVSDSAWTFLVPLPTAHNIFKCCRRQRWTVLNAVADIAKKTISPMKIKIKGQNQNFFEVFGLFSNSPIHTGLICVKIPATNFSCSGPFKQSQHN